ncbi:SDR family NAD(P)-dependent oxidoreductase [Streptomyces sp. NPDC058374]|uniref:SDR family NAD(P)-dependent oxidoreductase n=1 Tax=Streptomyces sp. NPDC058374 TaxID=3346466 RepID=UPI00365398C4
MRNEPGIECSVLVTQADFVMDNHRVHGVSVMPGVTFLDLVYRVLIAKGVDHRHCALRKVLFTEAVTVREGYEREIRVTVGAAPQDAPRPVTVESRWLRDGEPCAPWRDNARAELVTTDEPPLPALDLPALTSGGVRRRDMAELYARARAEEIRHRTPMQCFGPLYQGDGHLLAELRLDPSAAADEDLFHLHPAKMDASTLAGFGQTAVSGEDPFIPIYIDYFRAPRPLSRVFHVYAPRPERCAESGDMLTNDYALYDEKGEFLAEFRGIACKRIRHEGLITKLVAEADARADSEPAGGAETDTGTPQGGPAPTPASPSGDARELDEVTAMLREMVGAASNTDPASVRTGAGFYELGLDSVALLSLSEALEQRVGSRLYPTLLFEYSDIDSLARHLVTAYGLRGAGPAHLTDGDALGVGDDLADGTSPQASRADVGPAPSTSPEAHPAPPDEAAVLLREVWVPRAIGGAEPADGPAADHDLLVFGASDELADCLRRRHSGRVVHALHGTAFQTLASDVFRLDAGDRAQVDRLLDTLSAARGLPRDVVVVAPVADGTSAHARDRGADPLTAYWTVASALTAHRPGAPHALVFVHSGPPSAPEPRNAALGAFAATVSAETPVLRCRVVEFGLRPRSGFVADRVLAECADAVADPNPPAPAAGGREARYRDGLRQVRHHTVGPAAGNDNSGTALKEGGVYLLTGGSGGIGGLLADRLAREYRARLVLVGRRPLDEGLRERLDAWHRLGARVEYVRADVSRPSEAAGAVRRTRELFGRLDGVFHCAGATRDGLYFRTAPADLAPVLAAKTDGAVHLDEATRDDALDFFVLFSSVSTTVPNPGQAAYAYANAFLEHFARARSRRADRSGRSLAIGWPYWAEGGMRLAPDVLDRSRASAGNAPLPTETAFDILADCLARDDSRVVVLYGDPGRVTEQLATVQPLEDGAEEAAAETPWPDRAHRTRQEAARTGTGARDDDRRNCPVAVIGLAGQYPEAADLEAFWRNLAEGRDCVTEVPAERWDHSAYFSGDRTAPGRTYSKWGGFLDGVDVFDAAFFGISRKEAERMDPQERLFLTTAWRTLEDAGYPSAALRGERVGVFVGAMWNHYQLFTDSRSDVAPTAMHAAIANRVSYTLDLHGPSLAVDTACSSSLTALHLAVESIRRGESSLALAGGVNVTVHPQKYLQLAQGQFLSTDGRCRSFGADGDGYVPGEGVGAVLLKPLDRALAEGDHIHGIIHGTALNHTGRTSGFTVPSQTSQGRLIGAALAAAGWDPETVDYVEAHGTGTSLGDPIEVAGLGLGFTTTAPGGCALGSVKSNIGHLESAAGIAGLTKVLLQLRHGELVPSLHAERTNPHADLAGAGFRVQRERAPWPRRNDGVPRRAGVSAFGAGGAGAHVLVSEAPARVPVPAGAADRGPWVFALSAPDGVTLAAYARALADALPGPGPAASTATASPGTLERVTAWVADLLHLPADVVDPDEPLGDLGLDASGLRSLTDRMHAVGLVPAVEPTATTTLAALAPVETGRDASDPDAERSLLADVSYTLRSGRTPMAARLAVVASSVRGLRRALRDAAAHGTTGLVADPAGTTTPLDGTAQRWTAGADVDWAGPAAGRRRLSLPTAPLRQERHWIGRWHGGSTRPDAPAASPLAPPAPAPLTAPAPSPTEATGPYEGDEVDFQVVDPGIALVVMRDPSGVNMFTDGMMHGLTAAFAEIARRSDVKAVVLTGSGGVFSMGATPDALETLAGGGSRFTDAPFVYEGFLRCDRPVIAAVQGHASGGGLAFALHADMVVMSREASFSASFMKYGFTPGMGATYILEQRLGRALATEMFFTGGTYTGRALEQRGADLSFADPDDVLPTALALARSIAQKPLNAVRVLKADLADRVLGQLGSVIARESEMHDRVFGPESVALIQQHFAKIAAIRAEPLPVPVPGPVPVSVPEGPPAPAPQEPVSVSAPPASSGLDDARVTRTVEDALCASLYLDRSEIDHELSFSDMGLDSVGAVEMTREINRVHGLDLDSVTLYDHPTVPRLVDHILSLHSVTHALNAQVTALTAVPGGAHHPPGPTARAIPGTAVEPTHEPTAAERDPERALQPLAGQAADPVGGPTSEPVAASAPQPAGGPVSVPVAGPTPEPIAASAPRPVPAPVTVPPGKVALRPVGESPAEPEPLPAPAAGARQGPVVSLPVLDASDDAVPAPAAGVTGRDIAVVGMAGRFPDAPDLDTFWKNLVTGHDSVREVPRERWDVGPVFDTDRLAAGRTYSKWAAMLSSVDEFDAGFFQVSPLEAQAMDPQQRLFLETAWRALEDAGYAVRSSERRKWGVFVGCGAGDYADVLAAAGEDPASGYAFLGNSGSVLAARIAYLLNFSGPTMAVDTACSSSLVAVHLACESIRRGECEAAVAGGVAVLSTPRMHIMTSKTGMLSPTGRSAPFDASADGIVLGEGVGAVVLKSLERALADGDHIHGVIKAGGVNGDGRTNGLTAPSAVSQAELLAEVQRRAGVSAEDVTYVEAHGTGTPLGDPIEVKALTQVFGGGSDRPEPCGLGSVKANIGHTTMAAGIAGLLKVLLALRHGELPPTPHFSRANPEIDFGPSGLRVVDSATPWRPGRSGARIAGISSFGFSGTNAHLIVAEAPARESVGYGAGAGAARDAGQPGDSRPSHDGPDAATSYVVPVSARSEAALGRGLGALAEAVEALAGRPGAGAGPVRLPDVAFTLGAGREHFPVRAAFVVRDLAELIGVLRATAASGRFTGVFPDAFAGEGDGEPERVAARYVRGETVDWAARCAPGPVRRVPLPGYSFDRTPHRVSRTPAAASATSEPGMLRWSVTPDEWVVADHRVDGRPVLPGVASLGLLAGAMTDGRGLPGVARFSRVRWIRPIEVSAARELRLLTSPRPAGGVRFEVRGVADTDGEPPFVQGTWDGSGPSGEPERVDVRAVLDRCGSRRGAEKLYADFAAAGIAYGPAFQVLDGVRHGGTEAVGVLRTPPQADWASAPPSLHPALLDGALQTLSVLVTADGTGPAVPFALEALEVCGGGAESAPAYALATRDGQRFDVRMTDADGRVLLRFTGVALRVLGGPSGDACSVQGLVHVPALHTAPPLRRDGAVADAGRTLVVRPEGARAVADAVTAAVRRSGGRVTAVPPDADPAITLEPLPDAVYWFGESGDGPPSGAAHDRAAAGLFRLVKELVARGAGRRELTLKVIVPGSVGTGPGTEVRPHAAGLIGLARSVAAEYPRWRVGCVDPGPDPGTVRDASEADVLAERLLAEPCAEQVVVLRGERRLVQVLEPAPPLPAGATPFREGGCYLLVGGTGGIGRVLARHLAETHRAKVALVGRRAEDDGIRALLAELEALGGSSAYFRADVTDGPAVRRAVAAARARFGPLHGAFHGALVLRDRTLAKMDQEMFLDVLAPKTAGALALAEALREEPLDFLAYFSSAISFTDAPGQANYAAASTFEDACAAYLDRRMPFPVSVVNWGFWGSVGAVAGQSHIERFAALGVGSLEPAEGIAALEAVLAGGVAQSLVIKATPEGLARLGVRTPVSDAPDKTPTEIADETTDGTVCAPHGMVSTQGENFGASRAAFAELERTAGALLRAALVRHGALSLDGPVPSFDELRERLGCRPAGERLLTALLEILHRSAPTPYGAPATADPEVAVAALVGRFPDMSPHADLLRRCTEALPQVLDGSRNPMEVLFPKGSMELVERVYRGQAASDHYHRLTARETADVVTRAGVASDRRPVRVLEIGAGTGAGTAFVLAALDELAGPDSAHGLDVEYCYTDISAAFLRHGEKVFGATRPYPTFAALDIERDPTKQGFEPHTYDVVLATNVLHATRDLARALGHVRTLLRPGGVALVNEATRGSDFLTLTFGLTAGWWAYEDPGLRLPNAPLLDPARWHRALGAAGFGAVRTLGLPGTPVTELEQCLFVAEAPTGSAAPALHGAPSLDPARVRHYVRGVFADVLRFPPEDLEDEVTFENYGVDSLVSLTIISRFEEDLGDLPATLLFEQLTIARLAEYLTAERGAALAAVLASETPRERPETPEELRATGPDPAGVGGADRRRPDDIAIVGVSGRFPGAPDVDSFWELLSAGGSGVTEVPAGRWDWREHFDTRRGIPQRTNSRWGGFLEDIDRFDAGFFGVLPRDAENIDPQERLFLETAWNLLEETGHLGEHTREPQTGVFVGSMYGSYGQLAAAEGWPKGRLAGAHSAYWSLANRVSYFLDLYGPSFAVDSACSSSLTAVHLACESIRRGECRTAIAGGVNLILHPAHFVALSSRNMLAADGRCKVFDERADGFVPGEGVAAVLLKPLGRAEADGDRILGVIRSSLAGAGGKTGGYTVPNPNAQAALISEAVRRAGVEPGTIGYVEAHGTGTELGDPIEVAALARALGRTAGSGSAPCAVGSVKSNIGHLEGAAGIAALTKVLLQLRHLRIAPNANLETLNPKIDFGGGSLYVPRGLTPWPAPEGGGPRRAGISSFGAGGANVHLIVEEYEG